MRAFVAVLALPGVVAFLIPFLLVAGGAGIRPFRWIAVVPLALGIGLLLWCVREFYVSGKGTLAPWAPPRHLVVSGLYRLTRNPMYLAVTLILAGWCVGFASSRLFVYTLLVMLAFHLHVVLVEEPWLARTHREEWVRYSARVPRWVFRTRRQVIGAWAAALILAAIAGLIFEAVADGLASREFTPPGTLVDIGGRRLHLLCIGEGEPIVVFEHSGFGSSLSSPRAREQVAQHTTVCSYDRSGMGWSDPAGDSAVSTGDLARDLAVLQDRARLAGPYVLVASSIGGLTAELFARLYPERAAGLVFLDAANSLSLEQRRSVSRYLRPTACTAGVLGHFGIFRLLDPFGMGRAGEDGRRGMAITYNARVWDQLCRMARGLPDTIQEFATAPPLRSDLPLTVLTASSMEDHVPGLRWVADLQDLRAATIDSHQRFAKQSSRGAWRMVPDSTHLIGNSQPGAVAEAVLEMIAGLR